MFGYFDLAIAFLKVIFFSLDIQWAQKENTESLFGEKKDK